MSTVSVRGSTPVITRTARTISSTGPGRTEIWAAESVERVPDTPLPLWTYERTEVEGTPWEVIYTPTGQHLLERSLPAARAYTAHGALAHLRDEALGIIAAGGYEPGPAVFLRHGRPCPMPRGRQEMRLAEARRWRAIHDGQVRPAGGVQPQSLCECGGFLVWDNPTRAWTHVDACWYCWDPQGGWSQCSMAYRHDLCGERTPAPCAHSLCFGPNNLTSTQCAAWHESCCGCCHGEG